MRLLAFALLVAAVATAGAGCGVVGGSSGAPGSPEPSQLARDAFRGIQEAGSFRYTLDASLTAEGQSPLKLSLDGAFAKNELKADVSFDGGGQAFAGSLLVARSGFFVRFLDRWYGKELPAAQAQELEQSLGTEEAFGARFDEVFDGSVSEGPVADGVPTWAYNGELDSGALLDLMAEEGPVNDDARRQVEELAESARFTLLVGKADSLPRAFQLDLAGEGIDFTGVSGPSAGELTITVRGSFSAWGKPVSITPPGTYAPLEQLLGQLLGF